MTRRKTTKRKEPHEEYQPDIGIPIEKILTKAMQAKWSPEKDDSKPAEPKQSIEE